MEKARKWAKGRVGGVGSPLGRMSMESTRSSTFDPDGWGRTAPDICITVSRTGPNESLGMLIDPNTCVVTTVDKTSLAEKHNIEVGLQVTNINNTPVTTLEDIKQAVQKSPLDITFTFSDPRLSNDKSLMLIKDEIFTQASKEYQALKDRDKDATAAEAKSAKAYQQMKKTHTMSTQLCDTKVQDVRRAKEQISKSKAAQHLSALEEQLRTARMRSEEELENIKQTDAAIKVSVKKAQAENKALKIRLNILEDDGTKDETYAGARSSEHMQLAIKLQQLQEAIEEKRSIVDTGTSQTVDLNNKLESLQAIVKEGDTKAKYLKRSIDDMTAENEALQEEKQRMATMKQQGDEEYSETVKQLMEKLKSVGADKNKHLAQTSDLLNRVQGGESSVMKKLRSLEMELEIKRKDNEILQADNITTRSEESALLQKIEEKEKRGEILKQARKRMTEAEREVSVITEFAAKARKTMTELNESNNTLESKNRRNNNLNAEKSAAFEEEVALIREHEREIQQQKEHLSEVEPLEAQVAKLENDLATLLVELQNETLTAASLMRDVLSANCKVEAAKEKHNDAKNQLRGLLAEARIAQETVAMRQREIEQLSLQHDQGISDIACDRVIMKKKCEIKESDLIEQLDHAEAQTIEVEDSLRKLLQKLGDATDFDEPEEAPATETTSFTEPNSKYELSFLGLTEENIKLTELLGEIRDKIWAAEELKRAIDEEVVKKSREAAKKDAAITKHFTNNIDKEELQAVIESTMIDNMRLRDQNLKLSTGLQSLQL